jgi:hypothetical protein
MELGWRHVGDGLGCCFDAGRHARPARPAIDFVVGHRLPALSLPPRFMPGVVRRETSALGSGAGGGGVVKPRPNCSNFWLLIIPARALDSEA